MCSWKCSWNGHSGSAPGVLLECSWNAPGMLLGNRRYYWGSEIADTIGVYAIADTYASSTFFAGAIPRDSLEFLEHS